MIRHQLGGHAQPQAFGALALLSLALMWPSCTTPRVAHRSHESRVHQVSHHDSLRGEQHSHQLELLHRQVEQSSLNEYIEEDYLAHPQGGSPCLIRRRIRRHKLSATTQHDSARHLDSETYVVRRQTAQHHEQAIRQAHVAPSPRRRTRLTQWLMWSIGFVVLAVVVRYVYPIVAPLLKARRRRE